MATTEGKTPGDGYTSPFGNGKGATQADGPSTGAHDFLTDPEGGGPAGKGRDFTKESRPQTNGDGPTYNPESVPAGGRILLADPGPVSAKVAGTATAVTIKTPFKVG